MLSTPVSSPGLRPGWAGEPKWDGFRAAVSVDAGRVVLRSRSGTEMGPAFPEIVAGSVQLPDATAMDGELVVWDAAGRLAFERLQNRLARRGSGAVQAAEESACPLRGVRSAQALRDRDDRMAVPQAAGGAGVGVRRPPALRPRGRCARRPPTRTPCASGCRGRRSGWKVWSSSGSLMPISRR
ncbi:hypothetical protein ACGF5T_34990 [Streptomyces sp. NPDC047853]